MSKARPSRFTFVGIDQEQPCTITTTSRSYLLHEAYMSLRLAICDEKHLFSLKGSRHLYSGGDPLFVVHEEEDLCLTYASRIIISLLRNYVSDPFLLMQADPYPLPAYAYAPWCRAIFASCLALLDSFLRGAQLMPAVGVQIPSSRCLRRPLCSRGHVFVLENPFEVLFPYLKTYVALKVLISSSRRRTFKELFSLCKVPITLNSPLF